MKKLALTIEGELTYCSSAPENIGKGRCNHITHQDSLETINMFMKRIEKDYNYLQSKKPNRINVKTLDWLFLNYQEVAEENYNKILKYSSHVSIMSQRIKINKLRSNSIVEHQEFVMKLDKQRRELHNYAMGAIIELNRYANKLKVEPLYNGNVDDINRDKVAHAIFLLLIGDS